MSTCTLMLQRGGREVSREELAAVTIPPATATWFPLSHTEVLDTATQVLQAAGFNVSRTRLALARNNARFFGTLDLTSTIASGVNLAVGVRNSIDKSLPIAFCAGSRVFICDNLAFSSEIVIARKHTRFGEARFNEAICRAVQSLHQYRETEAARVRNWQHTELSADTADALLLRAYEQQIITAPLLPRIIREWRHPSFEDFQPRTLWSLFNAFTTVLGERQLSNPQQFAAMTLRLHGFFGEGQKDDRHPHDRGVTCMSSSDATWGQGATSILALFSFAPSTENPAMSSPKKKSRPVIKLFRIVFTYGNDTYAVVPLDTDLRVTKKIFRLQKQTGDRQTYEVHLTDQGPRCDCKGFFYRQKCKHVGMLKAARMLD